jgi:hypothetical protein
MSGKETIIWPDFLKMPQRGGYSYSPADRRAKAEMEIGSRYRVLFDTDETTLNCDFLLRLDQLAFFEAFEKHMLRQGSVWFEMPIMTAGIIQRHSVRFRERPKIGTFRGGFALVSMVLDVAERKTFDEGETWLLYQLGMNTFFDFEDRLQKVMNVDYPIALPYAA